jgi:hypothetical protein
MMDMPAARYFRRTKLRAPAAMRAENQGGWRLIYPRKLQALSLRQAHAVTIRLVTVGTDRGGTRPNILVVTARDS